MLADKEFGLNDVVEMKSRIPAGQTAGRSFGWEWISGSSARAVHTAS